MIQEIKAETRRKRSETTGAILTILRQHGRAMRNVDIARHFYGVQSPSPQQQVSISNRLAALSRDGEVTRVGWGLYAATKPVSLAERFAALEDEIARIKFRLDLLEP